MKQIITLIGLIISTQTLSQLPRKISIDDQIIKYDGFTISYNNTHEQANWVFYKLDSTDVVCDTKAKRKNKFIEDHKINGHSAYLIDYKGSGYDRGHLKASADERCDQKQMNQTFVMSNMSPQNPSFNRGGWKRLENYVRTLPLINDSIFIITGPILTDSLKTIGPNHVSVPEFYFKIIYVYDNGTLELICFLLPNEKITESIYTYKVPLIEIEVLSKLKFPKKLH